VNEEINQKRTYTEIETMESSSNKSATRRPSGIPRLSRLPVPRGAVNLSAEPNLDDARSSSSATCGDSTTLRYSARNLSGFIVQKDRNPVNRVSAVAKTLMENGSYNALPRRASPVKTEPLEPIVKQVREPENGASGLQDGADTQGESETALPTAHRRPRPSLSDRTIETLSQIPPSPSPRRRQSNAFTQDVPDGMLLRAGSSLSRSRPSTSHGYHVPLPSSRPASPIKPQRKTPAPNVTPTRRSVSSYAPISVPPPQKRPNLPSSTTPSKVHPSPSKATATRTSNLAGKSVSNTSSNPAQTATERSRTAPPATKAFAGLSDAPARGGSRFPPQKPTTSRGLINRPAEDHTPKSSAALRETIAKAKAAKRTAAKSQGKAAGNGFEIQVDSDVSRLRRKINMALEDGKLNIAALGFKEIPNEVINMSQYGSLESVDITRINAADNELETISDEVFPDIDSEAALREDDDFLGLFFGGLESLDLHGNRLLILPKGLRRLDNLTTLNLSKNRIKNTHLETVAEIHSLRELRLAENALVGTFPASLCGLEKLELLDLHDNAIAGIPEYVEEMRSLCVLNVSGNKLASLPFHALSSIPLTELDVSRNRLSGCLFPSDVIVLTNLKSLSVASNALTSLTTATSTGTLVLPNLQTLDISFNQIKSLPNMSVCVVLTTFSAANNQLSCVPKGIAALQHLRTVDLSNNGIKYVDLEIGNMEGLTNMNLEGNPLRQGERRLLGLSTEDLKCELRARSGAAGSKVEEE